ncbi:MAG: hypothetical protein ACKPKO_59825, partial [Candidatus Fonsibacter sp.]
MLPASLVLSQCILKGVGAIGGNLSAEDKGFILAEHPATYLATDAKSTTNSLFFSAEIHGWSSLLVATPFSIICLTVALFNEALNVLPAATGASCDPGMDQVP